MGAIKTLLLIGIYLGICFLVHKILLLLKKQMRVTVFMAVTFPALIITVPAGIMYFCITYPRKRKKEISYLVNNLSDSSVDRFIKYIKAWGCENNPEAWGQLKGAFRIANESPDITYNKKKELRDCLMLNGLKLYNNEMNIINNYNK